MSLFWISQFSFWGAGVAFSHSIRRRDNFYKRMSLFLGVVFLITLFWWSLGVEVGYEAECTIRILLTAMMCFFQYFCWELSYTAAVYQALWATAIWQMTTEVWSVVAHFRMDALLRQPAAIPIGMTVLYAVVLFVSSCTISIWMAADRKLSLGPRQMGSGLLLFGIVEILGISPELRNIDTERNTWLFLVLCQTICLVILYLQNEVFKNLHMRQELDMMNVLLKKEQEQYRMSRENIALINQKCHDMKHHIRALRTASKEERDRYLDELYETVQIYENIVKTGNEVLDTILTEKSLYCKDRGIVVSCVADGSQMDFINPFDLYSILGNALDNAIEAVEQFRNPDKRQIDVLIYRQQKFLVINIINPLEKTLVYEEELPVTTKSDKKYHGFGIRSIRYALSKYEGHLTINEEDGCFSLKMLIPIAELRKSRT